MFCSQEAPYIALYYLPFLALNLWTRVTVDDDLDAEVEIITWPVWRTWYLYWTGIPTLSFMPLLAAAVGLSASTALGSTTTQGIRDVSDSCVRGYLKKYCLPSALLGVILVSLLTVSRIVRGDQMGTNKMIMCCVFMQLLTVAYEVVFLLNPVLREIAKQRLAKSTQANEVNEEAACAGPRKADEDEEGSSSRKRQQQEEGEQKCEPVEKTSVSQQQSVFDEALRCYLRDLCLWQIIQLAFINAVRFACLWAAVGKGSGAFGAYYIRGWKSKEEWAPTWVQWALVVQWWVCMAAVFVRTVHVGLLIFRRRAT